VAALRQQKGGRNGAFLAAAAGVLSASESLADDEKRRTSTGSKRDPFAPDSATRRRFTENLLRLRKEKRFSVRTAAQKLGVAESTWSQWESGARFPNTFFFDLIAQIFGVQPCQLLRDGGCPRAQSMCAADDGRSLALADRVSDSVFDGDRPRARQRGVRTMGRRA